MKYLLTIVLSCVLLMQSPCLWARPQLLHGVHLPVAQLFMHVAAEADVNVVIAGDIETTAHVQWQGLAPGTALLNLCGLPAISCHWLAEKHLIVASTDAPYKPQMTALVEPLVFASAVDEIQSKVDLNEGMKSNFNSHASGIFSPILAPFGIDESRKLKELLANSSCLANRLQQRIKTAQVPTQFSTFFSN